MWWRTFEIAESRVGLGAWFLVPNRRFILLTSYRIDIEYVVVEISEADQVWCWLVIVGGVTTVGRLRRSPPRVFMSPRNAISSSDSTVTYIVDIS
jgi:hypothetical protein